MPTDYAQTVASANTRVRHLLGGAHHARDFRDETGALQSYMIKELQALRHGLWSFRQDQSISSTIDSMEQAEVAIRSALFDDTISYLSSASDNLSRLAVDAHDFSGEVQNLRHISWKDGIATGFAIGIGLTILALLMNLPIL